MCLIEYQPMAYHHGTGVDMENRINRNPTPVPELNGILNRFIAGLKNILGDTLLGAYLGGSFAHGGWDAYSDVDFNVVINRNLTPAERDALKVLHARIYTIDSYYARHLEGSYFPVKLLRDLSSTNQPVWYLDNGSLNFELSTHDNTLVNRWVLRRYGVVLYGPAPSQLIPPVDEGLLKAEVSAVMIKWGNEIINCVFQLDNRYIQCYTVLKFCRMLHTLVTGSVDSKIAGARWAQKNLDLSWSGLIEDALSARENQYQKIYHPSTQEKRDLTRTFVGDVLTQAEAHQKFSEGEV